MLSIRRLYKIGNGPSSSHTMGPSNATKYIISHYEDATYFEVTLFGSLALTGKGHLTDVIISKIFGDRKHKIIFDYSTIKVHPNTMVYKIYRNDILIDEVTIVSIGGGLISIEGVKEEDEIEVYPHKNFNEIKSYCLENNISLIDYIDRFESDGIRDYIEEIYKVMMDSIDRGLKKEGVLPGKLRVSRKAKEIYSRVIPEERSSRREKRLISAFAFASAEENASGGEVVTAPTCGSCGIIPSLVKYYEEQGYSHKEIIDAMMVAGLIGLIVSRNASISGAECGCQAEIGTASSMGAAFVSYLKGKNINAIERAAEIAMEHCLGLTCDPVDGYVQIPCIERNAIGALRAIEASTLTEFIGDTISKISFDVVVDTMYETGKDLNKVYRETSIGGLAKKYIGDKR